MKVYYPTTVVLTNPRATRKYRIVPRANSEPRIPWFEVPIGIGNMLLGTYN